MRCNRLVMSLISVAIVGCTGVDVTQGTGNNATPLAGVPFRIKVPVWIQETKVTETQWLVQFMLDDANPKTPIVTIPATGALLLRCVDHDLLRNTLDTMIATASTEAPAKALVERLAQLQTLEATPAAKAACRQVVTNVAKQEMRVSNEQFFINHRIPLFGSATGAYELNVDGTLSKASTTVTDETAKTLLGLFPIKEKLVRRWGTAADPNEITASGTRPPVSSLTVTVSLTPRVQLYTLKRTLHGSGQPVAETLAGAAGVTTPLKPLTIEDSRGETPQAELVSIELVDETPASKTNPKAFQLHGTVVPPQVEP